MLLASLVRKLPYIRSMELELRNSVFHTSKPYYSKQSEPVPLMFDISMRKISFGDKEASLFYCLDVCLWVEALLYVLAQSLV